MSSIAKISLVQWIDALLARGTYGFSKDYLHQTLATSTDIALKRGLNRLTAKGKIVSLYKGYYLVIPPQYAAKGMLPPHLYLDAFMNHLQRPYYVALLNAAAFHGAAHHQPQEYFVMTDFPTLRPTQKNGLKINYISIRELPAELIQKRKTEAGYLNISNPALTACDLVQFEKRIGGMNRAAAVISELAETLTPADFTPSLLRHVHTSTLQRLGYLLERVCSHQQLADTLFEGMAEHGLPFFRIPLKASQSAKGHSIDSRWKVVVNTSIEIDE